MIVWTVSADGEPWGELRLQKLPNYWALECIGRTEHAARAVYKAEQYHMTRSAMFIPMPFNLERVR